MSSEARHLRVIDGEGQVDEHLTAITTGEHELLEVVVKQRREMAALKGELSKLRKVDPDAETIMGLLERWQRKCHPKAKVSLDGRRAAATKKMLGLYKPEDLEAVIDCAADMPYESYGNRFTEPGPGRVRRDDLTFLLADESRVDRLLTLVHGTDGDEGRTAYKRSLWTRLQAEPALRAALASLGPEPRAEVIAGAVRWAATATAVPTGTWLGNPS